MKPDPVNAKFDSLRRLLERCLIDLKVARGGDRSLDRLSILQNNVYEASKQLREVVDHLDLYGREQRARKAASALLRKTQLASIWEELG